jgi:hypothetical protein
LNIRQAVPLLVERLRQQKVILFVGAGLSQASGLPGWKKLFERFCKELGSPEEENFPAVAAALIQEHIHNRKEIIEHIVKQTGAVNLELNPNHEFIKRLPFQIIITTNYDNLLEDLYGPSRLTRIYSDENMAYFDPLSAKRQLIYLHGDINHPDHMVVSSIDYQNFAEKRPIMVQRLKTLLQDYTFLFTGYSANDPNLQAVFDHFKLTYKENSNRHFIVMEDPGKVKQTELSIRFGLEPVLLKDKTELTSFLQALVEVYENSDRAAESDQGEEVEVPVVAVPVVPVSVFKIGEGYRNPIIFEEAFNKHNKDLKYPITAAEKKKIGDIIYYCQQFVGEDGFDNFFLIMEDEKEDAFCIKRGVGYYYNAKNYKTDLGIPISDEYYTTSYTGVKAAVQHFKIGNNPWEKRRLYYHLDDPYEGKAFYTKGGINNFYEIMGSEKSYLGLPTTNEKETEYGAISVFENGEIKWFNKTNSFQVNPMGKNP